MTCDDFAPLLAAAADQALDAPRRARLDAHLASCDACRRAFADQAAVAALLAATPAADVPREFLTRLDARIDESETVFGFVNYRAWTLRLAPVALVLAVAAWLGAGVQTPAMPSAGATSSVNTTTSAAQTFSPSSLADWEHEVSANALLEAALPSFAGDTHAR